MIQNYLKIALRNVLRHRGYAFINILGLGVGMACCLLIALYIRHDLSYDRYHAHADRIYRVGTERVRSGEVSRVAGSQVPLGPALAEEVAGIDEAVRFWRAFRPLLHYGDRHFREERFYFADPAVVDVFTLDFLAGDAATALQSPGTVVLTASAARKYFGAEDPMGRVLRYEGYPADTLDLTVTGVLRDLPDNTHLAFDFLASMAGIETERDNWGSTKPIWTYALLASGFTPAQLEAPLADFAGQHYRDEDAGVTLHLEPLADIHLYSSFSGGFKPGSNATYVYLFALIGFFILLIACINFMNLATARSMRRAREVGLRKVLGAQRLQLLGQFLGEAVLLSLFAMVVAAVIVDLVLPVFNAFAQKQLAFAYLTDGFWMAALVGTVLLVGLLAGSYPALFLARFSPVATLKGKFQATLAGARLRKGLVVFQFMVSIVLISATLLVYRQLDFIRSKGLGFDQEQVVVLPYSPNEEPLLAALRADPRVVAASVSQRVPVNTVNGDGRMLAREGLEDRIAVESYVIDDAFLDTYRMEVVAGRGLSRDFGTEAESFLLNETAVRALGWDTPADALGRRLEWSGSKSGTVVGVVRDFHMTSMHEAIEPLVLLTLPEDRWWRTFISVRLRPGDTAAALGFLERTWRAYTPEGSYAYFFIDDSYEALHRSDARFGVLFGLFAGLAIFVACLGLFGLAAFMAEQRTKEIGIRKVMGASVAGVVLLLSRDFARLVVLALLVAAPLAYFGMGRWLDGFAYRIDPGVGPFALAGAAALGIALLTVSYQALRAALADPVDALRYE